MNFFAASAIQVPTKKDSPPPNLRGLNGVSGLGGTGGSGGGGPSAAIRRNSSSSSLDVAATIFSSMQELEASGRNLSSLGSLSAFGRGGPGGAGGGIGAATAALERAAGMGGTAAGLSIQQSIQSMGGLGGAAGAGGNYSLAMATAGGAASAAAINRDRLNAIASAAASGRGSATRSSFSAHSRNNSNDSLHMLMGGAGAAANGHGGAGSNYTASIQAQAAALRRIEMEEMMLQQQQNTNQRAALLGNLKGGYAPMQSSTRRDSRSMLSLDDFTPEELLREVTRRQSQRNSRDLLAGMELPLEQPSPAGGGGGGGNNNAADRRASAGSIGMLEALSRNNSRDDLVDLYNQMRYRGSTQSSALRANSLDSFSSLALMAQERESGAMSNMSAPLRESAMEGETSTMSVPHSHSETNGTPSKNDLRDKPSRRNSMVESRRGSKRDSGGDVLVMVPTAKPSSKKIGKQASGKSNDSDTSSSTVVTDTQSPRPEKEKKLNGRKRNNSTASFDALLSVFGDELAKLDREKNGVSTEDDDKSATSANSVGFFNDLVEKTAAAAAVAAKQKVQEETTGGAATPKESPATRDQRRLSSSSSLSDYPRLQGDERDSSSTFAQERHPSASNDRVLSHMDAFAQERRPSANNDRVLSQMDAMLGRDLRQTTPSGGESSFVPTFGKNGANGPAANDYMRKMHSSASMMASLEAIRKEEFAIRERALLEEAMREEVMRGEAFFTAQQQRSRAAAAGLGPLAGGMPQNMMAFPHGMGGDSEMGRLAALFGGRVPLSAAGLMGAVGPAGAGGPYSMHSDAAHAMLARLQGIPGPGPLPVHSILHHDPSAAPMNGLIHPAEEQKPDEIHPEVALQRFLDKYGDDAKKSCDNMLDAIAETEKSLVSIHAWDRSQGLRKCHSRTVVKTRRSRAKLKAFLMGVDPPKEPQKKRKRAKKNKDGKE